MGSRAGLFTEHDVLLNVCDIHAYECTLVTAAFKKNANKIAVASAGLPKNHSSALQSGALQTHPQERSHLFQLFRAGLWKGQSQIFFRAWGTFTALSTTGCSAPVLGAPENHRDGSGKWE